MSNLDKINTILKRKVPVPQVESTIEKINQEEILDIFKTLETLLENSFAKSYRDAGLILASIHHNLFESAVYKNSEKARLSLLFLKSKFTQIANLTSKSVGPFVYSYTKHWFKLLLILESQANMYIKWLAFEEGSDLNEVIKHIDEVLPDLENTSLTGLADNTNTTKDQLYQILTENNTTDAGFLMMKFMYTLMRESILDNKIESQQKLLQIQLQFPDIESIRAFDEIIYEYGKNWYKISLQFKKWFTNFSEKLSQPENVKTIDRLWKGQFWYRIKGKRFKIVVESWKTNHSNSNTIINTVTNSFT